MSLSGRKGQKSPKRTQDNLFSTDVVEVLLGISEGPIQGLKDGAKSYYLGDTTLEDTDGKPRFDSYELVQREGGALGEEIVSRLGGFATSTTVQTELAYDIPVVRSATHPNIDYLDIRLIVNRLYRENDSGVFEHKGRIKIEYRESTSSTWLPVTVVTPETPSDLEKSGPGVTVYFNLKDEEDEQEQVSASPGDRETHLVGSSPETTTEGSLWFDSADNYRPHEWQDDAWVEIPGATFDSNTWSWSEQDVWGGGKTTRAFVSPTVPSSKSQGDYWVNTTDNKVYLYNGSAWIVAGTSLSPGKFRPRDSDEEPEFDGELVDGELTIKGKTTTPFVKELRVPVANIEGTYDIRVTRTSPYSDSGKSFFDITWESFQEVTGTSFIFPDLSTTQLTARASDQFSSVPEFSGIYKGRIIRVPTNYDPDTRVYTGIWDGTFKLAYSDNPAWVTYDLVMNTRYGMNAYYPVVLNKWDVYEASQWCDTLTTDGTPRFTFNDYITDPRNGREAVDYVCGVFGGRFFDDGNGSAVIRIDKDGNATNIFTPENVQDGVFVYSWTDIQTRYNDLTVSFINPDMNWQEDRRRVYDDDHIAEYGRIPLNFIAVGCTNTAEAVRRGRYKLITGITEKMLVNFKTTRQGLYMAPYDIILIADDDMGAGLHGRVLEADANSITLRDAIYLEPGFDYQIVFTTVNETTEEYETSTFTVSSGQTGTLSTILVDETLPTLPDKATFAIETTDGTNAPRAFRVMSITETDSDMVEVSAIAINRLKWDYVDGIVEDISDTIVRTEIKTRIKPEPVAAVRIRPTTGQVGNRTTYNLRLDWDPSPTPLATVYKVSVSRNNSPMQMLAETNNLDYELTDITPGEYVFHIRCSVVNGPDSDPAVIEHRLIGDYRDPTVVGNLRMVNEPFSTVFESRSPSFAWDPVTYPEHETYVVQVLDDLLALVYETTTTNLSFTYDYTLNETANGGIAERSFTVQVASQDQYGAVSAFTSLAVANVAPLAPSGIIVTASGDQALIQYDQPSIRDFVAVRVHQSDTSGFTPGPSNLVYEGPNTSVALKCDRGEFAYFKLTVVDVFGEQDLNYSDEQSVYIPTFSEELAFDTIPPAVPTGLDLSSAVDTSDPGFVKLTATWDANAEEDFAYYEFDIKEGAGNYISFQTSQETHVVRVLSGTGVTARVRAVDVLGNKSAYSTEVGHTTASDAVAPDTPTGLDAAGGFETIWLTWDGNTEADLSHYEVYENTTTTAPTAGTAATYATQSNQLVVTGFAGAVTRHYWVRAVDTSGNKSAWTSRVEATTTSIDETSLAPGLEPVKVVSSLPAAGGYTGPKTVFLTTDGKLYRYSSGAWTTEVPTSDLSGLVTDSQIDSIDSTKIDGQLTDAQIADIAAAKLTGQITSTQITDNAVTSAKINAGAVVAGKIATDAVTAGTIAANAVTSAKINAGAVVAGKIATDAVTAGTIAANAVTAGKIATDAVTAGTIAAGAVSTDKLAANAVTAAKVTTGELLTLSAQIKDAIVTNAKIVDLSAAKLTAGTALAGSITVSGVPLSTVQTRSEVRVPNAGIKKNYRNFTTVDTAESYVHGFNADGVAADVDGWISYNGDKLTLLKGTVWLSAGAIPETWIVYDMAGANFTGLSPSRYAAVRKLSSGTYEYNDNTNWVALTPTTDHIVIGTLTYDNTSVSQATIWAQAYTLTGAPAPGADVTSDNTAADTTNVGGTAAGTVRDNAALGAQDPATRINAAVTQIDPGKILVSGATSLADWRRGGDLTKIDGGAVSANTISANKLSIGMRNLAFEGLEFEHNSPVDNDVSWTAGTIRYTNDAGSVTSAAISAGSASWTTGVRYIYWVQGATTLSTTTTIGTAMAANNVVLAAYKGGTDLVTEYGRTVIDGSHIKTGSIDAERIQTGAIVADHISAGALNANVIGAGRITSNFLEVTDTMIIDEKDAGFSMGKESAYDTTGDGIFMGRTSEPDASTGFGFIVGRSTANYEEYIQASKQTGLVLHNAKFQRLFAIPGSYVDITSTQNIDLTAGGTVAPLTLSLEMLGGGSGGSSDSSEANGWNVAGNGSPGGNTVVQLRDGTTVISTYTANGAAVPNPGYVENTGGGGFFGGEGNTNGASGESSVWGDGGEGTWDWGDSNGGDNATGYGAGGGGGKADGDSNSKHGGRGGQAANLLSIPNIDVSGLASPNLVITIGGGGAGANSPNVSENRADGGDGSPGKLRYKVNAGEVFTADVLPLKPTATGTMAPNADFPDLGAGYWMFYVTSGDLEMEVFEIDNSGTLFRAFSTAAVSFVSEKTPVWDTGTKSGKTLNYRFFKMGPNS